MTLTWRKSPVRAVDADNSKKNGKHNNNNSSDTGSNMNEVPYFAVLDGELNIPLVYTATAIRRKRSYHRRYVRLCLVVLIPILIVAFVLQILWLRQNHGQYFKSTFGLEISDHPHFEAFTKDAPICDEVNVGDISYTLVTQLSDDRLWMMQYHCERWGLHHPISIAVLTNQTSTQITDTLINLGCSSDALKVQVHPADSLKDYPVNLLRNMALRNVQTSHVVYVDVDFWPSPNLWDMLHRSHVTQLLAEDYKNSIVLAAFQLQRQCKETVECPEANLPKMPKTQYELFQLMVKKEAYQFDPTNLGGHGSTRYKDWFTQKRSELLPIECILSNRYEPYLVFQYCQDLPPFQEAFTGYGKNKMTWTMQLLRSGWKLWQLSQAFVVHYPHLESPSRSAWNGNKDGTMMSRPSDKTVDLSRFKRGQIDKTYVAFRQWLHENVPDETVVDLCENAVNDDSKLWIN